MEKKVVAVSPVAKFWNRYKKQIIAILLILALFLIGEIATVTDYADVQKALCGTILGVDENCYLRLALSNGEVRHIYSGEIM